jgi:hypothetical protein
MTDDYQPADVEDRSDDHQHAREACEHALDALHGDDLSRAHALLNEAQTAVERARHDDAEQAYRETAYDCYD